MKWKHILIVLFFPVFLFHCKDNAQSNSSINSPELTEIADKHAEESETESKSDADRKAMIQEMNVAIHLVGPQKFSLFNRVINTDGRYKTVEIFKAGLPFSYEPDTRKTRLFYSNDKELKIAEMILEDLRKKTKSTIEIIQVDDTGEGDVVVVV